MMKLLFALVLVASCSALVRDQPCRDDIEPRVGFNQQLYHGFWYELERYDDNPVTLTDSHCNTATFSSAADGSTRIWNEARLDGQQWQQFAHGRVANPDDEVVHAIWNVTFDGVDGEDGGDIQLTILSTDYINYSLVYSCDDLPDGTSNEGYWFLSRSPGMPTRNQETIARSKIFS